MMVNIIVIINGFYLQLNVLYNIDKYQKSLLGVHGSCFSLH